MNYLVVHRTHYRYAGTVTRCCNEAHLHPRETATQHCLAHRLEVEPEAATWGERIDFFGNPATDFTVDGPFEDLVVTATSRVDVIEGTPPPDGGPAWEEARDWIAADRTPTGLDARQYCFDSPLVRVEPDLHAYALGSFGAGRPLIDGVRDLAARIHAEFRYEPGFTTVSTPLADVLRHRRGVCQDFAHLAIACCRAVGLSARYVSGYLETEPPSGGQRLTGADASHAWASTFVPGWGWFDIDPTNDRVAGVSYVTTAWGRDYSDVSPLRGVVFGGGPTQSLEVSVDVVRLPPTGPPAPTRPSRR